MCPSPQNPGLQSPMPSTPMPITLHHQEELNHSPNLKTPRPQLTVARNHNQPPSPKESSQNHPKSRTSFFSLQLSIHSFSLFNPGKKNTSSFTIQKTVGNERVEYYHLDMKDNQYPPRLWGSISKYIRFGRHAVK